MGETKETGDCRTLKRVPMNSQNTFLKNSLGSLIKEAAVVLSR
jgi:hypothetical protein